MNATKAAAAARELHQLGRGRSEDDVRARLVVLLNELGVSGGVRVEHWIHGASGSADLYLEGRRVIIETKAPGEASNPHEPQPRESGETHYEQVRRYVLAARREESRRLPFGRPDDAANPWIGVVTDGQNWHAWKFEDEAVEEGTALYGDSITMTRSPEQLLRRVDELVAWSWIDKPPVPDNPRPEFEGCLADLRRVRQDLPEVALISTETKYLLWLDMLKTSSMAPSGKSRQAEMFLSHTLLVVIARGVIHAVSHPDATPNPREILAEGFVAWVLSTESGRNWASDVLAIVGRFDWQSGDTDVLRNVYKEFIDKKDRKVFGEEYTPDWVARMLVDDVLDEPWVDQAVRRALDAVGEEDMVLHGTGVLDPTCGSGTFLYHAARRLLESHSMEDASNVRKADAVARLVHGIDIHPVAVEIARATLLRALPALPTGGERSLRVWQGDALLMNQDRGLFSADEGTDQIRIATPGRKEILLPREFARSTYFVAGIRAMVDEAAAGRPLPKWLAKTSHAKDLMAAMKSIASVVGAEGNSIWAWFIANITAPTLLAERKVDRIVANPPWVRMSEIQVESRKRELEGMAGKPGAAAPESLELWNGGEQATAFDIAQLFVRRCREKYLADPDRDPAAWLVPVSAITGGNWARFRRYHDVHLKQILDFSRMKESPFTGQHCCALLEHRPSAFAGRPRTPLLMVRPPTDGLVRRLARWTEAREQIRILPALPPIPRAESDYVDVFRNGATIFPHTLVLLDPGYTRKKGSRATVRTRKARPSGKAPWKSIRQRTGEIPSRWVVPAIFSEHVLPFCVRGPLEQAMIPLNAKGELDVRVASAEPFWTELEDLYAERKGRGRSTAKSLFDNINYWNKLSTQLPLSSRGAGSHGATVLYPTSGSIMRAARAGRDAVVDKKFYYWHGDDPDEAAYLVALLNAPVLREVFDAAGTSMRDFDLTPWEHVPIPRFDPKSSTHRRLVGLTHEAEVVAASWNEDHGAEHRGQYGASKRIRQRLHESGVFAKIDDCARRLLPEEVAAAEKRIRQRRRQK